MKLCLLPCLTHLEGINISKSVLHMAVHHQLAETQHLSAQVEGIAKSGFLSFLEKKIYRDITFMINNVQRNSVPKKLLFKNYHKDDRYLIFY